VLAPGVVAGFLPWWLTGWHAHDVWLPARAVAVALIVGGAAALIHAFARFVIEGVGTPAPAYPTERLVVGGLYRYVRNPMYIAVGATILGQALLLGQPVLVAYAGAFVVAVAAFVYGYEQPTLAHRFGAQYQAYRSAVPAWLPRPRARNGMITPAPDHGSDDADPPA
jgi:protein-S-isoprenylcysteine O-methyltransferase Ste14